MKYQNTLHYSNIVLLFAVFTLLVSCSGLPTATKQPEPIQPTQDTNPFEATAESDQQSQDNIQTELGGFMMGPVGFDPLQNKTFSYTGDPITLSFFYEGTGSDIEIGLMFFLDGVAQPYQIIETDHPDETSISTQEVYMSKFQVNSTRRIEFSVAITPTTGSIGDEFGLFPITLFAPSFMPKTEEGSFGIYHNASFYLPVTIRMEADAPQQSEDYIVIADLAPIPEYKLEDANLDASGRISQPVFIFYAGEFLGWAEPPQLLSDNGHISMHLSGYGGVEATYRVTVFVNHQPVPIEGRENFLIETQYDQVSTYTFNLDIPGEDRLNSLYVVVVPIGENYKNPNIYGQKVRSILLINDLVEPLSANGE